MVNNTAQLDLIFMALADGTRRGLLERLISGEQNVSELAAPYLKKISFPAISKHLRVMETAGLIERRKIGRTQQVSLRTESLQQSLAYIERYQQMWEHNFDALDQFLTEEKEKKTTKQRRARTRKVSGSNRKGKTK
ncbi:MAG: metalloregulator ArsR/SmtB family transcription factor [Gammaproteobacteria bacterium]|nr:metalloregulator ArsR/SmtB family transcription factor [Gammaproteobacteria bacterium]